MKIWDFSWKITAQLLIILGVLGFIATRIWENQVRLNMTIPEEYFKMLPVLLAYLYCIVLTIIGILALVGGKLLRHRPVVSKLVYIFAYVTGFLAIGLCCCNGSNSLIEISISALSICLVIVVSLGIFSKKYLASEATETNKKIYVASLSLVFVAILLIVFGLVLPRQVDVVARSFPDSTMRKIVRDASGRHFGFVQQSDLEHITCLDAWGKHIRSLEGLEKCTGLTKLELGLNMYISDITPLSNLRNLTALELSATGVSDIGPLTNLTNLAQLHLFSCQIKDVSPLTKLESLCTLDLGANNIKDIGPLANLNNLTDLDLGQNSISSVAPLSKLNRLENLSLYMNNISDISLLSNLTNLESLSLANNPLSADSINTYIPQLEAGGVKVYR